MHFIRDLDNLCSSTVYNQGQLTLIFTTIRAAYNQRRLKTELIPQAYNRLPDRANENVAN